MERNNFMTSELKQIRFDCQESRSLLRKIEEEMQGTKKTTKRYARLGIIKAELKAAISLSENILARFKVAVEKNDVENLRDVKTKATEHQAKIRNALIFSRGVYLGLLKNVEVKGEC